MKEKRCYEVPNITVISVDAQNDIIQTSGVLESTKLTNVGRTKSRLKTSISNLFN